MSNWPGVVELCSTRFNWRGYTSDPSTSEHFHLSNSPGVIVLCTTRFDNQRVGGTHEWGTSAFYHMSNWPGVVELCSTRCNWWEVYIWTQYIWTLPPVKLTWYNSALYHYLMASWPKHKANVSMTWPHAALGHQMSLLEGYILSEILNKVCIQCSLNCILQNVKMTLCSTPLGHQMPLPGVSAHLRVHFIGKYELTSKFTLASQRSFLWKTNNNKISPILLV